MHFTASHSQLFKRTSNSIKNVTAVIGETNDLCSNIRLSLRHKVGVAKPRHSVSQLL